MRWYMNWRIETENARIVYLENALAVQEHPKFRTMLQLCRYRVKKLEALFKEEDTA